MGTRTIRRTWKVEGVLTDVTTAKLSDPTGTYGVKRDDTDAVVVAAGTAMTKVSTGTYEYSFTEPAEGLAYTAYVEFVYGGATYHIEHDLPALGTEDDDSLAVTYSILDREIGRFLGYGRETADWADDTDKVTDIEDIRKAGLRRFYYPPPLPGERYSHEWSFLGPVAELTTTEDDADYDLPADFAGMVSATLSYDPDSVLFYYTLELTSEERVRSALVTKYTGKPTMAATRPKALDATAGTRYEMILYPVPDGEYTIHYRYRVNPAPLTATNKYPYGGQEHGETIIEACLAAAEAKLNDGVGVHENRFRECLAMSVSHDRRLAAPPRLGYNGDRSDGGAPPDSRYFADTVVTYNGVTY